jgi:hypothetical protein
VLSDTSKGFVALTKDIPSQSTIFAKSSLLVSRHLRCQPWEVVQCVLLGLDARTPANGYRDAADTCVSDSLLEHYL